MRSCLLATALSEAAGYDEQVRETTYWVALLRYLGCTAHAHEVSAVFGDEIGLRALTLIQDAADPEDMVKGAIEYATAGRRTEESAAIATSLAAGVQEWAVHNFTSGCEAADMLASRIGLSTDARECLQFTFERWNGQGFPTGAQGESIPLPMRIVHLAQDMEAISRRMSPAAAQAAARDRRDRTYDPHLVDVFLDGGTSWFEALDSVDPWDAVLALEPAPTRVLAATELDEALATLADFVDVKSVYMTGHSRRCADIANDAGRYLGFSDDDVLDVRRAALVHELGTTAIPNSIWDKPAALTRSEMDRVRLHTVLCEQMLRRSEALSPLSAIACAHHERLDGSGYHKGLQADSTSTAAALLAAVDVYVSLTSTRPQRAALSESDAVEEMQRQVAVGLLHDKAVQAVLVATGNAEPGRSRSRRTHNVAGLSDREMDVLRLAARGLTTAQIADQLVISPKTADHHIQHIYAKLGVSTRAAAALWASQNGVVA